MTNDPKDSDLLLPTDAGISTYIRRLIPDWDAWMAEVAKAARRKPGPAANLRRRDPDPNWCKQPPSDESRRCQAIAKSTGKRCTRWTVAPGARFCWGHGGAADAPTARSVVRAYRRGALGEIREAHRAAVRVIRWLKTGRAKDVAYVAQVAQEALGIDHRPPATVTCLGMDALDASRHDEGRAWRLWLRDLKAQRKRIAPDTKAALDAAKEANTTERHHNPRSGERDTQ